VNSTKRRAQSPNLGNTSDHVVDQTPDSVEASDMLPASRPHCERDHCLLLALQDFDVHVDMSDVLGKSAAGSSDGDEARLDDNVNAGGDYEFFGLEDVPHL